MEIDRASGPDRDEKGPLQHEESHPPMRYGRIAGVDLPVSRLVLGTMIFSPRDLPLTSRMCDHFVSLGGTTFDTARIYNGGEAERALGAWMQMRGNRSSIVIVGKGAHPDAQGSRVTPEAIRADLATSLECLQTDYIDLYLLHRDNPAVPVGEIVECLADLRRTGRIRAYGGSNWSVERLQEANDYARTHGLTPFAASSPNFSLAVMNEPPWAGCVSAANEGREWYRREQFPLLAWSSQAQGFFAGPYEPDVRANADMVRVWYNDQNFVRRDRARDLGQRKGVSAHVVALAYVLAQPFPTYALIGPHSVEEMNASIEALGVTLDADELRWLNLE